MAGVGGSSVPAYGRVESFSASGRFELLERESALAALREAAEAVERDRRGAAVLVGGEAGVGKTALLRRFCDELETPVLRGACDALFTPRPLGPLLAVAERVGGDLESVVASEALPHEVATALAAELRTGSPTVFVLEDLHWADEATLDVLRLLVRRVELLPVLVVASYRDDELDRDHPLRRVLGEFATSGSVDRLKLRRLSFDAVTMLAEPYGADAEELYETTVGNPFFVVEALAAGEDEVPDSVRDAVLSRIARLPPRALELVEAVAVVPSHAELWLLEALAGGAVERLDECLTSGVLEVEGTRVGFRHELARLAVEESIGPNRRTALHRKALSALANPPVGGLDHARLAHHAEAAGDVAAVLRYAPLAGDRAAARGAHREAAAQYARALRHADRLPLAERATLAERRSRACYLTDQSEEAIAAGEDALAWRRQLGQRLEEGAVLRWLGEILWCPGRTGEAERRARESVALLETLPPGRELALAYATLATRCAAADRPDEARLWGRRSLDLAERLGDAQLAVRALGTLGWCGPDDGVEPLGASLERARRAGLAEEAAWISVRLAGCAVEERDHAAARAVLEDGLAYCTERGLELFRLYLLAYRGRSELDRGCWSEAADTAATVLRLRRTSTTPSVVALVTLALVRARRGDPGHRELLDEAWLLAERTGELGRLGPVAAARAEAAWLDGDAEGVDAATAAVLALACERESERVIAELTAWRRRAGFDDEGRVDAARLWPECPYELALELADCDEDESLRRALEQLQALGAQPAAALVARRLRERGARGLPRGPRRTTRENPFGLTRRQLEVLALVAEGLRNAAIAERLVLSERTVDHHVGAILRKLEARTRGEASATAMRLGLVGQDG